MSLIAWFPLNGNTTNQGIYNSSIVNSGATVTQPGKITPNCYSFDGSSNYMTITMPTFTPFAQISISLWYYLDSYNSYSPILGFGEADGHHGLWLRHGNGASNLRIEYGDGTTNYDKDTGATSLLSTWYHIVVVYDGVDIKVYRDGIELVSYSAPSAGIGTNSILQLATFWAGKAKCKINDVRVYDHALSKTEIKKLSQGLCLHYQFNFEDFYSKLDYIESTGTQYIDTEITCVLEHTYKLNGSIIYITTSPTNQIIGFGGNAGNGIGTAGTTFWECSGSTCSTNTLYNIEWERTPTSWNRIINGVSYPGTGGVPTSLKGTTIKLFASTGSVSNPTIMYYCQMKLYSCQICDNGNLVRDFIPCVRKSDGEVGLYDNIENKFYENKGEGKFLTPYSSDVYDAIEYLESTGTQWINTNVPVSANTNIQAALNFSSAFKYNMMYGVWSAFSLALVAENVVCAGGGSISSQNTGNYCTTNTDYLIIHKPGTLTIGTSEVSLGSDQNVTTSRKILLFGASDASTGDIPYAWESYGKGKIYWFKIYDGNTIVRDFVPVKRKSDEVLGLFDLVENKFYTNAGEDNFTAGPSTSQTFQLYDSSGYKNDLIVSSISHSEDTQIGTGAISFNDANNHTSYPNTRNDSTAKELTVSCWFKQTNRSGYQALVVNRWDSLYNWMLYTHKLDGSIQLHGNDQYKSTIIPELNKWHHVVATVNSSLKYNLYLDGQHVITDQTYSYHADSPSYTGIGGYNGSERFIGNIADIKIFATALSEQDIKELYKANLVINKDKSIITNNVNANWIAPTIEFNEKHTLNLNDITENTSEEISVSSLNNYTKLEYIWSNGNQYIDTGYKYATNNGQLQAKLMPLELGSNYYTYRAGGAYGGEPNRSFILYNAYSMHYIGIGNNDYNTTILCSNKTVYELNYYAKNGILSANINGQHYSTTYTGSLVTNKKYYIFGNNENTDSTAGYMGSYRLYYLNLYDNEQLVREFIPVKRNSDDAIGLYDLITEKFYLSPNNSKFGAGPAITDLSNVITCSQIIEY